MNPPCQSSIEAFHTVTLYIYIFYCERSYNQVADLPRWGILRERPFIHEGNYLVYVFYLIKNNRNLDKEGNYIDKIL